MKNPSRLLALGALIAALPLFASIDKFGSPRGKAPDGWTKFEWSEKRAVLFGHYAPTDEELALIDKAMPTKPTAEPKSARKVLLFYRCDYPHSSIATGVAAFRRMAQKTGAFSVDASDDPAVFSPENLAKYDAVLLNNTVGYEGFIGEAGQAALLDFVKGGKGLVGIHAAADAAKGWKEGAEMMGGVFQCHPWRATGTWALKLESSEHPLNAAFENEGFFFRDEIYYYREGSFSRDRSRVLSSLDMSQGRNFDGEGMHEKLRDLVKADGDYPVAWLHKFGEGRVFYSNLGHNNTTYWHPAVLRSWLDGIQYVLGDLKADATPSTELKDAKVVFTPAKKIFFLAGRPSHNSGDHEFRAGSILLAKALNRQVELPVDAEVISGWPVDDKVLDGAAAIVIYCDADSVHRKQYARIKQLSDSGTGFFFMHYGVHPKDPMDGINHYLPTVGGFMETNFSVNPHWAADMSVPNGHEVGRGIDKPVRALDEFYYSLIFREDAFPLATAVPTRENMVEGSNLWNRRATDAYGKPVRLMWGFEREGGARGGGFTGGHYHRNWAIDDFRKMVLNAIVWTAGLDVPEGGVKSDEISEDELNANLDKKQTMLRIKLPLKDPMAYRQDLLKARAERKRASEARKKKKQVAPKKNEKQAAEWRPLLDKDLSQWETWIGVPHRSLEIAGVPKSNSKDGRSGTPLGLNNDPLNVFSTIEEDGEPVLAIGGQIYGGLTTKEEFENYQLSMQFKWGEKKWEPRLDGQRDSGVLIHCVGKHGAFWNVWMRCLECQVQERDVGDFFALAGTEADVPSGTSGRVRYAADGKLREVSTSARRSEDFEKPHGEWNQLDIYTVGDRVIHVVNGRVNMVLVNAREKIKDGTRPLTKGKIQIQSEAAEIYYRDVRLRPISKFPEEFKSAFPK